MGSVRKGVLLAIVVLLVLLVGAGAALAAKPTKVVIITMDQMKPWYAEHYDMDQRPLAAESRRQLQERDVGQMASETVVSHNTIVSGLFPKHMGWSDEVIRDTDNVLGYGAGAIVTVGDLNYGQYHAAGRGRGLPQARRLPARQVPRQDRRQRRGARTIRSSLDGRLELRHLGDVWEQEQTSAFTVPAGPPVVRHLSWSVRRQRARLHRERRPLQVSVGNDLSTASPSPAPNDYYGTKADTPAWLYPEDGRYVPGPYETISSGDDWVADAAIAVMDNEDWSALHLNFSGIDKIGHMWGGGAVDKLADLRLGSGTIHGSRSTCLGSPRTPTTSSASVMTELRAEGHWSRPCIIVLADHGST